jgi:transcriptional regulator with XRE-family HTH domain
MKIMSSTKMHESFSTENVLSSKQIVVTKERESLADYVRRVRREKDLSLNDVRIQSGYQIVNSYVSRIENGQVINVGLEKLRALAKGLGVSEEELFSVARGKLPSEDPEFNKSRFAELALKFDRLPPDSRIDVEALINLLDRELERLARERKRKK